MNVQVGVGVIVMKDDKILLGKRINKHGAGMWALPGGKMEYGESFTSVCKREVLEEAGLHISLLADVPLLVTNDIFDEHELHFVTLFFVATYVAGGLELKEPEKCSEWEWFKSEFPPSPLFNSTPTALSYFEQLKPLYQQIITQLSDMKSDETIN